MPLSSPIENLQPHYGVVVVGSGYGGGVAASRLARAGQQVCLLERGKEFQPGEYPRTLLEASAEMQIDAPLVHTGSETALFDFHVNRDISVLVGCGLGGTSLINANVSIRAEPRLFDDPRWPAALGADDLLEEGYRLAEEMLKPSPYPSDQPHLAKADALEHSAEKMGEKFYRLPINVTFRDGENHVGVMQHACTLCGDCVSGCNYSAKNTTLTNYLQDAHNHGAEIFTEVHVEHVERGDGVWIIYYRRLHHGLKRFHAPLMFVKADIVVLAAGTLGSTAILLRSKQAGLPMSESVGRRFTGNGDVLGFAYNGDRPAHAVGYGHHSPGALPAVGPCITSVIDMRGGERELEQGMIIEEGATPGALAQLLPAALAANSALDHVFQKPPEAARQADSLLRGAYHGAIDNTQTYLVMTHDDANGSMRLEDGRVRIDWPGVASQASIQRANENLKRAAQSSGATYLTNPLRVNLANDSLITVHPLGGAAMADGADQGVVNHKGQVFSGAAGEEVHEGFYVCDGSVMPMSLGVNPLLTITALSERTVALLARDRGWEIPYALPSKPRPQASVATAGLEFTETMKGSLSTDDEKESPFEFILSIRSDDVKRMLEEEQHAARISGSVHAPALSARALTVTEGHFQLFTIDPDTANTRRMWYRMKLHAAEGETYYFEGYKRVQNRQGFNVWRDTTTLFITVHREAAKAGRAFGTGILRIRPRDFLTQLTTIRVFHAANAAERLRLTAEFGKFFAGRLFEVYGRLPGI